VKQVNEQVHYMMKFMMGKCRLQFSRGAEYRQTMTFECKHLVTIVVMAIDVRELREGSAKMFMASR